MKNYILFLLLFILSTTYVFSQEYAIDKNSIMFSGTGSFSSFGGDFYEVNDNNRLTSITFSPSINYFIMEGIFLGGGLGYSRLSQGDESISSVSIGPNLGYAFGNSQSKLYPYLASGFRYNSNSVGDDSISGTTISVGCGLIILGSKNVGIVIEATYNIIDLKKKDANESVSGNIFSLGFGVAGFLF